MGPRPIDLMALWTLMELAVQVEDEVRDLSFSLFPFDLTEEGVAEKATGKRGFLIQANDPLIQKFFELKERVIFQD